MRRPALKTGFPEMGWGSTPPLSAKANVAQMVEQWIENPCVTGSIPVFGTNAMWVCTERLGSGLQIRAMQVRLLSPTPVLFPDSVMVAQHTLTVSV